AIILLDIVMPQMSGMEAARELRILDNVSKIIFLTSSPEFAVDSYAVDAFYYALKPIWKEKLFAVLEKALTEIYTQNELSILAKCKSGLTRVPLHMLEYVEVIGRTIYYHLINGIVFEENGVMAKLEQTLLTYAQFAKPHRAFIINLDCIDTLTLREVKLCTTVKIPVAKANYKDVKASYIARVLWRGGEQICSSL
ncbi:MAG: LytR/AlgR family response regulator transcription factor, partial [Acetanaerobacterium sp.]